MLHLICLPIGQSASDEVLSGACEQNRERTMVVTSSRTLVQKFRLAGLNAANFDYLANDILRQCGETEVRLLSRKAQELILQKVLQELRETGQLHYFERLRNRKGFLRSMASLMGELGRSGVSVEELEEALRSWARSGVQKTNAKVPGTEGDFPDKEETGSGNYGEKDTEVGRIYRAYRNYLKTHSVYDVEGLYRLAAAALSARAGTEVRLKWDTLYFIGFYRFDALQLKILEQAAKLCEIRVILPYEADRPELYGATEFTYGDLMRYAHRGSMADIREGRCLVERGKLPAEQRPPALVHLLHDLRRENAGRCDAGGAIEVWQSVDREEELRTVLRHIKERIISKKAVPSQIAVIVRDQEAYSGFRTLCEEYGIPVDLPQSALLTANPLFSYIQKTLVIREKRGRQCVEAWLDLLTDPLQAVLFDVDTRQLAEAAASRYHTDPDRLLEQISALPGGDRLKELTKAVRTLPEQATAQGYTEALEGFLFVLQAQRKLGEQYRGKGISLPELKNIICGEEEIRSLLQSLLRDYRICGLDQKVLREGEFAEAFAEAAASRTIVLQAGNGQGISVLSAASLEDARYRCVYVLGLVEGEFPFYKNENWIYDDKERAALRDLGVELPDSVSGYQEDIHFFANACAAATEHLVLSYFKNEEEDASFYVDEVRSLFNELPVQEKNPVRAAADALSWRELALALARADAVNEMRERVPEGTRDPRAALDNMVAAALTDRNRLEGIGKFNGKLTGQTLLARLQKALGSRYSASRLEAYLRCPFSFLVGYGWQKQAAEPVEEDMDPMMRGNLLHTVLERFIGKHLEEELVPGAEETLRQELDTIFDGVCTEEEANGRLYAGPFWEKDKEQQRSALHRWLKNEIAYSQNSSFRPVAVEKKFGDLAAGEISFKTGTHEIALNGRIDRVDSDGSSLFITDYKSGRVPAKSGFMQSDLQMPLYILAASELFSGKDTEKRKGSVSCAEDMQDADRRRLRTGGAAVIGGGYYSLAEGKRKDSFLFEGAEAKLPVKTFSKVLLPGTEEAVPLRDMEELRKGMETLIEDLMQRLEKGDFTPTPTPGCDRFCPAADICRFCILQNREEENGHEGE